MGFTFGPLDLQFHAVGLHSPRPNARLQRLKRCSQSMNRKKNEQSVLNGNIVDRSSLFVSGVHESSRFTPQ